MQSTHRRLTDMAYHRKNAWVRGGQDGLASLQPGSQSNRKFLGPPGETSPGEPSTTCYTASSSGSAPARVAGLPTGIPPTIRHVSETSVYSFWNNSSFCKCSLTFWREFITQHPLTVFYLLIILTWESKWAKHLSTPKNAQTKCLRNCPGGWNGAVVVCWARCPVWCSVVGSILLWGEFFWHRGFFPWSYNGFWLHSPKTLSDESINQGLVCAHMQAITQTQKILTFMS